MTFTHFLKQFVIFFWLPGTAYSNFMLGTIISRAHKSKTLNSARMTEGYFKKNKKNLR